MIRQQPKDLYFAANRYLSLPNAALCRLRYRKPRHAEGHYLHLGSGENYLDGMINIEGFFFRKKDAWLDLRNALPFADKSAFLVYCSHTLEHLFPDEAIRLLGEIRRTLKDDGVARIATPSLEFALELAAGRTAALPQRSFADAHGQAIDYLFCDGQHKYGYSFSVLESFARQAGFARVENVGLAARAYGRIVVGEEMVGSLVVELRR